MHALQYMTVKLNWETSQHHNTVETSLWLRQTVTHYLALQSAMIVSERRQICLQWSGQTLIYYQNANEHNDTATSLRINECLGTPVVNQSIPTRTYFKVLSCHTTLQG